MINQDGIDDYNQSLWTKLGHPAFEENFLEGIEWWNVEEEE